MRPANSSISSASGAVIDDSRLQPLVDNHKAFLRFVERRVGSREEAEDILQDAFGRSLEKLAQLEDDESMVRWFYRVLRNAVVDHYRRRAAAGRARDAFASAFEEAVPPPAVRNEICGCIRTLASTLKQEYAEALQKIDVDGMPVKEFAAAEGISASNAGVRVFRAREALRKQVVRSCGTCAEHGCVDCTCGKGRLQASGSRLQAG